jgi:hypothetical protein
MNESAELERAYRRLVACYPRSFRRENEDEIVTVLLATAAEGRRKPGIAEAADLIRGALRMRLGLSRAPRTVLAAVRLMYLGAVAEVGVVISLLLTEGSVRAAVARWNPQLTASQLGSLTSVFIIDTVILCLATAGWLWMAFENGKGRDWARVVATVCFAFYTVAVIVDLADGTPRYAPADMIATAVSWAVGLAAVVLLFMKQSWPYYARQ